MKNLVSIRRLYTIVLLKNLCHLGSKVQANISGKPISINQEFPLFSSAHFLELQLLSSHGYFNHFRITRYMKNVTDDGNIQWIKRPDKPILQSVVLPCSSLASRDLMPDFQKANRSLFYKHDQFRRTFQYVIDVSPNSDLPDHVDIFIPLDDYPLIKTNRQISLT